ncbi:MAG: FxsA family protein, partial [Bradymonadaceae bacterium]
LVVGTGLLGAFLGKSEGLRAWRRIQEDLSRGSMPGDAILDGLAVLIACAFLVTPGVLTDIAGIALLLPFARRPIKHLIRKRFTRMIENPDVGFIGFSSFDSFDSFHDMHGAHGYRGHERAEGVIDITPNDDDYDERSDGN